MSLIVTLLLIGFCLWLLYLPEVPIHGTFKKIIVAVCVIYAIVLVLQSLGVIGPIEFARLH